uniref:AlNc14C58G4352 protein n=1 Tax=Albugo laibachii Nc14 TaxID=890382 RepID=F0WCH4_9STRA|nr:AlNc14C58G4352 [Albugo laibachii Nc14]|eukprot:CCA18889.1 AlNc14C58G4352 [Albugo laibachii Nc14]
MQLNQIEEFVQFDKDRIGRLFLISGVESFEAFYHNLHLEMLHLVISADYNVLRAWITVGRRTIQKYRITCYMIQQLRQLMLVPVYEWILSDLI